MRSKNMVALATNYAQLVAKATNCSLAFFGHQNPRNCRRSEVSSAIKIQLSRVLVLDRLIIALLRRGAALAELLSIAHYISAEIDAFPADGANGALAFVARKFPWIELDTHPLLGKQNFFRQLAIGQHLLLVFVLQLRVQLAGGFF